MKSATTTKHTASGIAFNGPCTLTGLLIGTDKINDPLITIYDGTDNTGVERIPSTTIDSSLLGFNGLQISVPIRFENGIYVEITTGGTVEVIPQFLIGVG